MSSTLRAARLRSFRLASLGAAGRLLLHEVQWLKYSQRRGAHLQLIDPEDVVVPNGQHRRRPTRYLLHRSTALQSFAASFADLASVFKLAALLVSRSTRMIGLQLAASAPQATQHALCLGNHRAGREGPYT